MHDEHQILTSFLAHNIVSLFYFLLHHLVSVLCAKGYFHIIVQLQYMPFASDLFLTTNKACTYADWAGIRQTLYATLKKKERICYKYSQFNFYLKFHGFCQDLLFDFMYIFRSNLSRMLHFQHGSTLKKCHEQWNLMNKIACLCRSHSVCTQQSKMQIFYFERKLSCFSKLPRLQ